MIEVQQLKKSFDGFAALDGATLTVPAGAVYGLVGPNGAGKSTLIRHITGIYHQDAGEVLVDGAPVFENPAAKARIASIPDDWYYFLQSDMRDMMRFYRGFYPNFNQDRYEKFKEIFEIDEKRSIRRLSKGMQKQVAFWLAMCTMPDYLVLDEPVDGLDPVMRRQVWSLIMNDVAERGTTVLVSSHNLRELEDVCDHIALLHQGKVVLDKDVYDVKTGIYKVQTVLPANASLSGVQVVNRTDRGSLTTMIIRGEKEMIEDYFEVMNPKFFEMIPLTLEEIFIIEMEEAGYEVTGNF